MSRPMRRPARDRIRRRPEFDTLEGRYSAGSLLGWTAVGGMALPSLRPVEPIGGRRLVDPGQARERNRSGPAARARGHRYDLAPAVDHADPGSIGRGRRP